MEEKMFIDRADEIRELERSLSAKGAELAILYGRRRIGKSRLLSEIAKRGKIDLVAMMEDADYQTNLGKFAKAIEARLRLNSFRPQTFREAFEALPENFRVAIDEFSYISQAAGEFQAIWEEIAKKKQLKLVLSGSLLKTMEELHFSLKSPLYGRATSVIKLGPLPFEHVFEWYAGWRIEDVIETYFAVGGVPRYLELLEKPSKAAIGRQFFSKDGILLREGKLLLKESFPSSPVFPKIMFGIASGMTEATKIANGAGLKGSEVGKYLSLLSEYGFVEKRYPVLGGGKKDVRFYMQDRFFAFWSRFVWPYYGEIDAGASGGAQTRLDGEFSAFSGREFERLCIELVLRRTIQLPFVPEKVGKQWGRAEGGTYEIDVAASGNGGKDIVFGECKWGENVDGAALENGLAEKASAVKLPGAKKSHFMLFAKSFRKKPEHATMVDLKTIGGAIRAGLSEKRKR